GLTTDHDRILTCLRVFELLLECERIVRELAERTFQRTQLALYGVRTFERSGAFHERRAREVVTPFADGDFSLAIPLARLLHEPFAAPRELLLVGDRASGGSADLDEGLLHFLNNQTDHLLRIFCLIEQRIDVGVDDVRQSRKHAHGVASFGSKWSGPISVASLGNSASVPSGHRSPERC